MTDNRLVEAIDTERIIRMVSDKTNRKIDDALLNIIAETLRATAFEIQRTSSVNDNEYILANEIKRAAYHIDPPFENRIKCFLEENACRMSDGTVRKISSFLAKMLDREILQSTKNEGKS